MMEKKEIHEWIQTLCTKSERGITKKKEKTLPVYLAFRELFSHMLGDKMNKLW